MVALRVPEMFFLPAETRENLKFLRKIDVFHLVLKFCSNINEGIGIQLPFYFVILVNIAASFIRLIFSFCGSGFWVDISRIAVSKKCLQLNSKTDLTTIGLLLEFFYWNMPRFIVFTSACTEICKKCSNVFLFLRYQKFSIVDLWGILVCFLNVPELFSHRVL